MLRHMKLTLTGLEISSAGKIFNKSQERSNCVVSCKGQRPFPPLSRKTTNGRFFFNPHPPPSSKRPLRSGKIFQHFEGPVFEVESIGLALCEYVTGAGFSSRPSQLSFNNGRVNRNIKNEINMESVLKKKQFLNIPSTR